MSNPKSLKDVLLKGAEQALKKGIYNVQLLVNFETPQSSIKHIDPTLHWMLLWRSTYLTLLSLTLYEMFDLKSIPRNIL